MGEVCNAGSRLLVDRSIYDEFVERFIELGRDAYQPGDPLDPATNMGPLVTHGDQQRVLGLIETGRTRRCAAASSAATRRRELEARRLCQPDAVRRREATT